MNPKNGQLVFCTIELLLFIILAVRLAISSLIERLKRKRPLSIQIYFWFYIFFILNSLSYCVVSLIMIKGSFRLNSNVLDYFKNLLYTASFVYLQIYCYKIVTIPNNDNFYNGNVLKNLRENTILEKWIYTSSIIITIIQTLSIGLSPIFLTVSLIKIEIISWIPILISTITLLKFTKATKNNEPIIRRWFRYALFSLFVVPLSFLVNIFSQFIDLFEYGAFWVLLLRGVFIAFRTCQLITIAHCAFLNLDVRLLYD